MPKLDEIAASASPVAITIRDAARMGEGDSHAAIVKAAMAVTKKGSAYRYARTTNTPLTANVAYATIPGSATSANSTYPSARPERSAGAP